MQVGSSGDNMPMKHCVALVVAAGRGTRLGGDLPKQWRDLAGRPLLRHSLAILAAHPSVHSVRAVIHPDDLSFYEQAAEGLSLPPPIMGGKTRQESVRLGLEALAEDAPDVVLIHDGARPFLDPGLVSRVIAALDSHAAALPALKVHDSLKQERQGFVAASVPRDGLWRAQTPQGFHFQPILAAHRAVQDHTLTDDAAVAEMAGINVALVEGCEDNVKITTQEDLDRARSRLDKPKETRFGTGFDVHRFCPGDHVTLCNVAIPHTMGLAGHSDADVALHALTDAVLGAIAAGDIGHHFPPSDPRWKGADSAQFLEHAVRLVAALGGRILHADVTIICEGPKIGPHRSALRRRLSEILKIGEGRVSVKATTTEELGFTGRREGIAAQAAATVALPPG